MWEEIYNKIQQDLTGMWDAVSNTTIQVVQDAADWMDEKSHSAYGRSQEIEEARTGGDPVVLDNRPSDEELDIFLDTTDSTIVEDLGSEDLEPPVSSVDSAIDSVEAVFPSNGMLSEIATVESRRGEDPNTYREDYHGGVMQVDEIGFEDTQDVASHPKLKAKFDKIKEEFGIDWTKTTWKDLRNPLHSAIAARLFLSNKSGEIPETVEGRADYWKEEYNTVKGKGSSKEYLERLKQ